jgi:hypothetical protein
MLYEKVIGYLLYLFVLHYMLNGIVLNFDLRSQKLSSLPKLLM